MVWMMCGGVMWWYGDEGRTAVIRVTIALMGMSILFSLENDAEEPR